MNLQNMRERVMKEYKWYEAPTWSLTNLASVCVSLCVYLIFANLFSHNFAMITGWIVYCGLVVYGDFCWAKDKNATC